MTCSGFCWRSPTWGCWVYFGLATFRNGHYWLFWIGLFLSFLSIIGALISPTPPAAGTA